MFARVSSDRLLSFLLGLAIVIAGCQLVAAQDDPTNGETDPIKLFERGQDAHAKKDFQKAVGLYQAALKLKPEFPEAEYQRGVALTSLEKLPEAEQAFKRAIELKKDWALPYSALGSLLIRLKREPEAESILRQAIRLGARDANTLDSLSMARFHAGDKQEALLLARQATEGEEAPAAAWAWRGSIERSTGNKEAALLSLNQSLKVDANYVPALKERAELYIAASDYEHAIDDLKAALALQPQDKEIAIKLGRVYRTAGKADEAVRIFQAYGYDDSGDRPPSGRSDQQLDLINGTREDIEASNSDDPEKALPALEKLLAKNPKNANLWARLGEVIRRTNPQRSADAYRQANDIDPKNPKYVIGYASALIQLRRFPEAEALLRRVIALNPDDYTAHANLALSLYEMKRFAEALPEFEFLAHMRPEIAATYFFIATAHDNLTEYQQALEAYQQFLARANQTENKLEIEKVNLRLPSLRAQIQRGQGVKKKTP